MSETPTPQRIEAATVAEHEKLLAQELLKQVQLPGTKVRMEKARAAGREISFAEALEEMTNFLFRFRESLKYNKKIDELNLQLIMAEWHLKINKAFDNGSDGWVDRVSKVIEGLNKKFLESMEGLTGSDPREKVGSIQFETMPARKELEKFGISQDDETLELHFEEFYRRGEKISVGQSALKDLSRVAEIIVDKFPYVKAVTGYLWLFDHPLVKQLGFQVIGPDESRGSRGNSNWLQFVDRNGQINQERINKFLETGEFPMIAQLGFIPVVGFLKRFLPPERRGTITLQELRKGRKKIEKDLQDFSQSIRERWDKISLDDLSLIFQEKNPALDWLVENDLKDDFFNILFQTKKDGLSLREVGALESVKNFDSKLKQAQAAYKIDPGKSYQVEI